MHDLVIGLFINRYEFGLKLWVLKHLSTTLPKKERDGARLAALMSESEINEDIKQIIGEIGS